MESGKIVFVKIIDKWGTKREVNLNYIVCMVDSGAGESYSLEMVNGTKISFNRYSNESFLRWYQEYLQAF